MKCLELNRVFSATMWFIVRNYRDKTMADTLMYVPNDDTQNFLFCRLQLGIETFGHSTLCTYQSKFNKSPKSS